MNVAELAANLQNFMAQSPENGNAAVCIGDSNGACYHIERGDDCHGFGSAEHYLILVPSPVGAFNAKSLRRM